uniref:FHA domain-containing protein n=1 Tax=Guillardia theta TaxID=55529 RepID=A0A7S4PBE6_GUITH
MRPTSWRGRKFCQPPGKSGQAGSGMWRFVGLLEPEENAEAAATKTVVCLIPNEGEFCGRMINMGKDGSNSNVVKHLRAKHPEEYKYFLETSSKARLVSSRRIDVLGPNPHKVAARSFERKRKKPRTDKQGDDGHGSDETQILTDDDVANKMSPAAILEVLCEKGNRVRHPLYMGTNFIGRDVDCDVIIKDKAVSRKHVRIDLSNNQDTQAHVVDLGSTNPTTILKQGKQVPLQMQTVHVVHLPFKFWLGTSQCVLMPIGSLDSSETKKQSAVLRRESEGGALDITNDFSAVDDTSEGETGAVHAEGSSAEVQQKGSVEVAMMNTSLAPSFSAAD